MPVKHESCPRRRYYDYEDIVDITESDDYAHDRNEYGDDDDVGEEEDEMYIAGGLQGFFQHALPIGSAIPQPIPSHTSQARVLMDNYSTNPQAFRRMMINMMDRMDTMISRMESTQQNIRMVCGQIEMQQERVQQAVEHVESMQQIILQELDQIKAQQ